MNLPLKPIYLLADSQLLFWRKDNRLFLDSVRTYIERESPAAAYIGASNDDIADYYNIFEAAMESIGITDCRMIPSSLTDEDASFIMRADLILLAGGDAVKGWRVFEQNGLRDLIIRKYYEGALLIGVSAGAMQLGLLVWPEQEPLTDKLVSTFGLAPFIISVHDEKQEWREMESVLRSADSPRPGIGIPTGGGLVYHSDHSLESVRHPVYEITVKDGRTIRSLLWPESKADLEKVAEADYIV